MIKRRTINRGTPARIFARGGFFRDILWVVVLASLGGVSYSRPFIPPDDSTVLAEVPAGARHAEVAARQVAARRLDVALPLAQLYIKRARSTGDLRFLGYAEGVLGPWIGEAAGGAVSRASAPASADALVLHATVLQSRHDFLRALSVLEQARALRPDDPQAWLTTATVLRVLGRYEQSMSACEQVAVRADPVVAELCKQSIRGLTGDLPSAYAAISQISSQGMPAEGRGWRNSELGEMAERFGKGAEGERWFRIGLTASPGA